MISLYSILNEVLVSQKSKLASGTEHDIYPSKTNPDRVYKLGKRKVVEKWLHIFQKHPDVFPKVFRAGKLNKDTGDFYYVEVEKLNTKKALNEWEYIEDVLELFGYVDKESFSVFSDLDFYFQSDKIDNEILNLLKHKDSKAHDLLLKWNNFIKKVRNIVNIYNEKMTLDVHRHNFGYDSMGKMKCLDI